MIRSLPLRLAPLALVPVAIACGDGATGPGSLRTFTSPTLTVDGLQWTGTVDVMESFPVQLVGRIAVANEGDEARTLVFESGCTALLRAYRPQIPNAFLVWDQGDVADCSGGPGEIEIAPGETVELSTPRVSARTILDGGKPNDEYGIAVYARANGRNVELQVGGVDLAVPSP